MLNIALLSINQLIGKLLSLNNDRLGENNMAGKPGSGNRGGARPGAGAKKGQHRVHVHELRAAIERHAGMNYEDILGITHKKLFNDFQNDKHVKEYVVFQENINKRLLEQPVQEVQVTQPYEELSNDEIQDRINNLLTRQALATSVKIIQHNENSESMDPIYVQSEEDSSTD